MKIKKLMFMAIAIVTIASLVTTSVFATGSTSVEKSYIDNSSLLPKISLTSDGLIDNTKVKLIDANGGKLKSPEWVSGLIITELNIAQASPTGTFEGMKYVIDHLAETGVNGVYLDPIYNGKHYCNDGPATVNKYLTGKNNYDDGWKVVADFVKYAHSKNIRVFFDVVTWGINEQSELYESKKCKIDSHFNEKGHKEDVVDDNHWFSTIHPTYDSYQLNWNCKEMEDWFVEQLIKMIEITDADGFRADCGIKYCGHSLYKRTRDALYQKNRYIAIIGEMEADDTLDIFDFSEHAMTVEGNVNEGDRFVDGSLNIVNTVQNGAYGSFDTTTSYEAGTSGTKTFYSSLVSCHDTKEFKSKGSYLPMAYASILSPFIPMWYIGEEWNNQHASASGNQWLLANIIDWNSIDSNRDFYENIKAYLRIRLQNPEIFTYFPDNHREINICRVETNKSMNLQSYARYAKGKGILVIPNKNQAEGNFEVTVPYKEMGMSLSDNYQITNMLTNKIIASGSAAELKTFTTKIADGQVAVYSIQKIDKQSTNENENIDKNENKNENINENQNSVNSNGTTNQKEEQKEQTNAPITGDSFPILLFIILAFSSLATAVLIKYHKKNSSN